MAKTKARPAGEEARPWDDIGIGDQVKHPTWGNGTVLNRYGSGDEAKAIVVFTEEGQKKLMLRFAKLKKIGSAPRPEPGAKKASTPKPIRVPDEDVILDGIEPIADDEPIGALPEEEEPSDIFGDEAEDFPDTPDKGGYNE